MNIILNITAFSLCIIWFHKRLNSGIKKPILPVILIYLVASIFIFALSLFIQAEYLDGVHYLIIGGISLFTFWFWTTISIIQKNRKHDTRKNIVGDLSQNILLLIIPLLIWLLISNMSLKIGG